MQYLQATASAADLSNNRCNDFQMSWHCFQQSLTHIARTWCHREDIISYHTAWSILRRNVFCVRSSLKVGNVVCSSCILIRPIHIISETHLAMFWIHVRICSSAVRIHHASDSCRCIIHHLLFFIHYSSFIIQYSRFIIRYSSSIMHQSLFTIHQSPFIIHGSSSITHH